MNTYDVAIIGSGPAGLFAAYTLAGSGLNVVIIDQNRYSSGGLMNDCKLTLHPEVSMDYKYLGLTKKQAQDYIDFIDAKFCEHGPFSNYYGVDKKKITPIMKKAEKVGAWIVPCPVRHVGTNNSKLVRENFKKDLESKGIKFDLGILVNEILLNPDKSFSLKAGGLDYNAKYLIVAPGRSEIGSYWFLKQAEKLGLDYKTSGFVQVGVRVEVFHEFYDHITDVLYDAKVYAKTPRGDECRTFCTNPKGFLRFDSQTLKYKDKFLRCLNGHALTNRHSKNTNFAILIKYGLTEPNTDNVKAARDFIVKTYRHGGGKPVVQRWGDMERERRSWLATFNDGGSNGKGLIQPTFEAGKILTPGDLGWVFAYNELKGIKHFFINVLGELAPNILHPSTCLAAPEAKNSFAIDIPTSQNMETNIENLFVAGDGCGKSRGIVGAAVSGILAGEGVKKKL